MILPKFEFQLRAYLYSTHVTYFWYYIYFSALDSSMCAITPLKWISEDKNAHLLFSVDKILGEGRLVVKMNFLYCPQWICRLIKTVSKSVDTYQIPPIQCDSMFSFSVRSEFRHFYNLFLLIHLESVQIKNIISTEMNVRAGLLLFK